ncbi:MAG: type II secretion system GspH family protein [Candidatus Pacebacteria bacterium]|nr:type II secretion system GspH family protein [Candidatus Paceibacterota bacterium]
MKKNPNTVVISSYKGFTLIELLVVIAIIGILSTIIFATLNGAREKAQTARAQSDMNQMMTIMGGAQINTNTRLGEMSGVGYNSGNGCTGDLTQLGTGACETPWRNAIDAIMTNYDPTKDGEPFYEDPWGNPYVLDINEGQSTSPFCVVNTLLSAGPNLTVDGGTGDDIVFFPPYERCSN